MSTFDPNSLPTKRVASGVLLRDRDGAVLLVETTYKEFWEIPGGMVEDGESPREAARRECIEELGVDLEIGKPVCVHYAEGVRTPGDGVMFVFDAGVTDLGPDDFTLPVEELRSAEFVAPAHLGHRLHPVMVARMLAAIHGADSGHLAYLER